MRDTPRSYARSAVRFFATPWRPWTPSSRRSSPRTGRSQMREPLPIELDEATAGADAHASAVRRHEADELRKALAGLPRQQREAILLREVRGLSYEEVASALSVTNSAVESLVFRARR